MDTNPVVRFSSSIWVALGYIYPKDQRRLLTMVPGACCVILQFCYLLFSDKGLEKTTLHGFLSVLHINCLFRAVFIQFNRDRYEKFCNDFLHLYDSIMISGDDKSVAALKRMVIRAGYFTNFNFFFGCLTAVAFCSYPLLIEGRDLPYGIYIPGINLEASPLYETAYITELGITAIGIGLYIPFISMIMSFILFGICLIEILTLKFKDLLPEEDQDKLALKLRLYVEYHTRNIRYMDELNSLISMLCLVEIILFGLLLSALLFLLLISERLERNVMSVCYISFILFQLFTFYWLCNDVISQSSMMADAIYDIPWYTYNIKNQKSILIMMTRSQQRPMMIMIGAFTPVTLERFQSILNVSYTYITLLRGKLQ